MIDKIKRALFALAIAAGLLLAAVQYVEMFRAPQHSEHRPNLRQ